MSATADDVKVTMFENRVRHLAQQRYSRLLPWVQVYTEGGEAHNFDRLGSGEMAAKATRKTATPDNESPWTRRQCIPAPYHRGDVYEKADVNQMLVDPESAYVKNHGMAAGRKYDDLIIASAVGDSRDGTGTPVAWVGAAQTVGTGAASITFDNVAEVGQIFAENNIDPEEPKVFVISPVQQRKLLQLTEATSKDYTVMDALRKGYVDSWMGFSWVVSTRLEAPAVGEINCLAFTRSAIGFMMNEAASSEVAKDPSISFAWRVYTYMEAGAIRVEDEHMVRVHLLDSL